MNDQDEKHVITRARAEQLLNYMMNTGTGATPLAAAIDLVNYLRQLPRLQDVVPPVAEPPKEPPPP
jgi:hypothetical protein